MSQFPMSWLKDALPKNISLMLVTWEVSQLPISGFVLAFKNFSFMSVTNVVTTRFQSAAVADLVLNCCWVNTWYWTPWYKAVPFPSGIPLATRVPFSFMYMAGQVPQTGCFAVAKFGAKVFGRVFIFGTHHDDKSLSKAVFPLKKWIMLVTFDVSHDDNDPAL